MTDRPILFSSPMVRAILDGRKTQTRRVLVPRGRLSLFDGSWSDGYVLDPGNEEWRRSEMRFAIGDRLWVREAWRADVTLDLVPPREMQDHDDVWYETFATEERRVVSTRAGKLRPSMFMPRWASRLTLVVTEVRVERLQDISEADAIAEGCGQYASSTKLHRDRPFDASLKGRYREGFSELWEGLNAKRGYGWAANPWVVALTFTVHHKNIDAPGAKEAA